MVRLSTAAGARLRLGPATRTLACASEPSAEDKLLRGEPFMFDITMNDGSGRRSFWMHPAIPVQSHFYAIAPSTSK